jgi:hypothetical protein
MGDDFIITVRCTLGSREVLAKSKDVHHRAESRLRHSQRPELVRRRDREADVYIGFAFLRDRRQCRDNENRTKPAEDRELMRKQEYKL